MIWLMKYFFILIWSVLLAFWWWNLLSTNWTKQNWVGVGIVLLTASLMLSPLVYCFVVGYKKLRQN